MQLIYTKVIYFVLIACIFANARNDDIFCKPNIFINSLELSITEHLSVRFCLCGLSRILPKACLRRQGAQSAG